MDDTKRFLEFYTAVLPEDAICSLAFYNTPAKKWQFLCLTPQQLRDFSAYPTGCDAYIRVTTLQTVPPKGKRGKAENTQGGSMVWLDYDFYDVPGMTFNKALAKIQHLSPPPSCTVNSGHGLQAWWKLKTFEIDPEAISNASHNMARALGLKEGADHVWDTSRILRIPGTLNFKHDPTMSVSIIDLNDITYDLPDFGVPGPFTLESLSEPLRNRIVSEETAKAEGATLKDGDRVDKSANDMAIAVRLLSLGYSSTTIQMVLTSIEWFSGAHYIERGCDLAYVLRTIQRAQAYLDAKGDDETPWLVKGPKGGVHFLPTELANKVLELYPTLTVGGTTYIYRDGVFRMDTESIPKYIQRLLVKDDYNRKWKEDTEEWIVDETAYTPPLVIEHPDIINLLNGLFSIHDHSLTPHSPAERSFVQLPVTYDPEMKSQKVLDFVGEIIATDAIPAFWEFLGCVLLPGNDFKRTLLLIGESNTGKSSILALIRRFLGSENTSSSPLQELASTFGAAQLFGKLANICADMPMSTLENPGLLKSLTGGDQVSAQRKYGQPFEFTNSAKLISSANDFTSVAKPDSAFFDRFLVIPCDNKFTFGKDAIINIVETFTSEDLSAFLNYALEGLDRLRLNNVFTMSASMELKKQAFRESADSVEEFIFHATHLDPNARLPKADVYEAYKRWCTRAGRSSVNSNLFYRKMNRSLSHYGMTVANSMVNEMHVQRDMYVGRALDETVEVNDGIVHYTQPI